MLRSQNNPADPEPARPFPSLAVGHLPLIYQKSYLTLEPSTLLEINLVTSQHQSCLRVSGGAFGGEQGGERAGSPGPEGLRGGRTVCTFFSHPAPSDRGSRLR